MGALPSFDSLMEGARAAVLRDAEEHAATPDFFESVQRARQIAPDEVSEEALEQARALAEVLPMRASVSEPGPVDGELGSFLAEVVAQREQVAAERRLAPIPATPGLQSSRRGGRVLGVALAMAAAVALAVGIGSLVRTAGQSERDGTVDQAVHQESKDDASASAPHRKPLSSRADASPSPNLEPRPPPVDDAEEEGDVEPPEETSGPESVPTSGENQRKASQRTKDERMRQLDAEAQARWRAGDLAGAEAKFRELIRVAPSRRWRELAYGDLFALARQAHGPEREVALWREYLQKYPRGRHADDARAGLCRRTSPGERRNACWTDYLSDFPRGAHRGNAERSLGSSSQ